MTIGAVVEDLMLFSRIDSIADAARAQVVRVGSPADLPSDVDLVLVDWSARQPSWTGPLQQLRDSGTRVVVFGRHTDLEAHAAARAAGLGPMWARSKLLAELPTAIGAA